MFVLRERYDVVIVGSGPAGLATAFYLKDHIPEMIRSKEVKVCILDKTTYPSGGLINDGKMNLTPHIGFDDFSSGRVDEATAWQHINYFEDIICRHCDAPISGIDEVRIAYWNEECSKHGIKLVTETRQRHIGTDRSKQLIRGMRKELEDAGIEFRLGHAVQEFWRDNNNNFTSAIKSTDGDYSIHCKYLVVAPGRLGTKWFRKRLDAIKAQYKLAPIEIGVRIEMLYEDYPIAFDIRDPKLKVQMPNGDVVKTFCTNPRGRIRFDMPEQAIQYKGEDYQMINGDGLRDPEQQTKNTNFAILNKVALIDPEGDTEEYAKYLAINTLRTGDWKPLVQRLGHFFDNRRSKPKHFGNPGEKVQSTLVDDEGQLHTVTPGDINIAFFARTATNIKQMIETLARVMPQVKNYENLIYAPEIKFQNVQVEVTPTLETTVRNLYVAGNGAGLSSGIVGAASNGILVAKGILEKLG